MQVYLTSPCSFDEAEACEIVGLYLLNKLQTILGRDPVGLYRDNELAAISSKSGRRLDQLRKELIKVFKG